MMQTIVAEHPYSGHPTCCHACALEAWVQAKERVACLSGPTSSIEADELRELAESFHREGELHKAKLVDAAADAIARRAAQ